MDTASDTTTRTRMWTLPIGSSYQLDGRWGTCPRQALLEEERNGKGRNQRKKAGAEDQIQAERSTF